MYWYILIPLLHAHALPLPINKSKCSDPPTTHIDSVSIYIIFLCIAKVQEALINITCSDLETEMFFLHAQLGSYTLATWLTNLDTASMESWHVSLPCM